jgi:outer membrane protein assembly factor BamB
MFDIFLVRGNRPTTRGHQDSQGLTAHTPCPAKKRTASQARSTTWLWTLALLAVLVGCSNTTSSSHTSPATPASTNRLSTPLSLPPQALTPTPTSSAPTSADWTTYHNDNSRAGYVADAPDPGRLTRAWNVSLDGAVYAEPLVIGGHVLVATENDSLYSLDAGTGKVLWRTNVGTPMPLSQLPCGNIDPLGITGTPVYDPATNLVFAIAEISGPSHILVGVDASTGTVRIRRLAEPLDGDIRAHQQRAALVLSQGLVYIAYGGLDGDCGNYHGWVIASRTDGQGALLSYRLPTQREGGIWAASGPAADSAGHIYVAVGNGAATGGTWDKTDSVLRLSPSLQYEDGFAPQQWAQDNAGDADLGSMGPLLLPGGLVYADGKTGLGYLLHADALGGVGGQAQVASICSAYGGSAALGMHLFVPCTDGLREVVVGPGTRLTVGWHAPGQINGSPIVAGHTVYSLKQNGTLYALNSDNGAVIASQFVGETSRFATPTYSGGHIYVGTMAGIVAITIS